MWRKSLIKGKFTGLILTKLDGDSRGGAALPLKRLPDAQSNSLEWEKNLTI